MNAQLLIDGVHVQPAAGYYDVIDPATEEVAGVAPEATADQIKAAAASARRASVEWSQTPLAERTDLVARLAEILEGNSDSLVPILQSETGATTAVARPGQFDSALHHLRYAAKAVASDLNEALPPYVEAGTGKLVAATINRAPAGVVACITPFNFPLVCAAQMIGPALVAGNSVILKPAPVNPLAVLAMADAASAAGIPAGVLNVVNGRASALGEALVASTDVDMVSFTGSTAIGRRIAASAGGGMKRVLLELGGKGAAIVLDDADLEAAVSSISMTWSVHSGQVCNTPTRVIAHRSIYAELIERLAAAACELAVGDPTDPTTVVGPLTTRDHRDRVQGYVDSGIAEGATVVVGKRTSTHRGFYVSPTLLSDATTQMKVVQEEVFGPVVVALAPFSTDEEALHLANDSAFGLQDYIWGKDTNRAYRIAKRLRTGYVSINNGSRSPDAPFGGFGLSGMGRDNGPYSLLAYTEPQSIGWAG